jgi:ABC-type glycerol-3-phosphate transport system permease component
MRRLKSFQRWLGFLIVGGGGLVMVLPFVWLITSSFKAANRIYTFPPQFIPDPFRWQNYIEVFTAVPVLCPEYNHHGLRNDRYGLVYHSAGYAARLRFMAATLRFASSGDLMLPYVVTMIPIYVMFRKRAGKHAASAHRTFFFGDAFSSSCCASSSELSRQNWKMRRASMGPVLADLVPDHGPMASGGSW